MRLTCAGCNTCGLIQICPRPTDSALTEFYKNDYRSFYQGIKNPSDEYITQMRKNERLDYTVAHLKLSIDFDRIEKLLDFGCSEGALFKAFSRAGFTGRMVGIEANPEFAAFATSTPGVTVHSSLADINEPVDLVIVNHVLEHLTRPREILLALRGRLNAGGRLYIDVPDAEQYSSIQDFHIAHVAHYTSRTLHQLVRDAGYVVLELEKHEPPSHPKSLRLLARPLDHGETDETIDPPSGNSEVETWRKIAAFPVVVPEIKHRLKLRRRAVKDWLRNLIRR
jgi:2-polyprenyl-3-methyl-5-hydroxy-6-metoxy-1,4-benzoquinol methylase